MSYLGRSAKLSLKAQEKVSFLATAGQTSKTGLSYTPTFVEVYVNGVLLTDTTDFTATNGNSITFTVALLVNDEVTVVSLKTFTVADHYNKTEADVLLAAKAPLASPSFTGTVTAGNLKLSSDNVKNEGSTLYVGTTGAFPTQFYNNNANTMHITSSGNVGIGGSTITDVNLLNLQGAGASKNIGMVLNDTTTGRIFNISNGGNALKFFDYTASAERMRIDAAGIVTMPYQPSFGARGLSNAQSGGGTTGSNHTLVFSSEKNNTGNHYSTSTGLFTAPVAGRYFVTFSGLYNASNNNTGPAYLMHNGTEKYRAYHQGSGSSYEQISVSGVLEVAANDTISVYSTIAGWHTGGETSFSGFLIG